MKLTPQWKRRASSAALSVGILLSGLGGAGYAFAADNPFLAPSEVPSVPPAPVAPISNPRPVAPPAPAAPVTPVQVYTPRVAPVAPPPPPEPVPEVFAPAAPGPAGTYRAPLTQEQARDEGVTHVTSESEMVQVSTRVSGTTSPIVDTVTAAPRALANTGAGVEATILAGVMLTMAGGGSLAMSRRARA